MLINIVFLEEVKVCKIKFNKKKQNKPVIQKIKKILKCRDREKVDKQDGMPM